MAEAKVYEKGNDIRVSFGDVLIGGQQNCSINMESETSSTTTKDSGDWSESEVVGLSWTVDLDGLVVVTDAGLDAVEEAFTSKQMVDVKYGKAGAYKTGKAIVKSYSQNAPQREKSTYSISLEGVGELKKDTGTPASLKINK